jgi:recombination protein RecA
MARDRSAKASAPKVATKDSVAKAEAPTRRQRGNTDKQSEARARKNVEKGELGDTLKDIAATHGKLAVRTGRETRQPARISTGSFFLDLANFGGVPTSRVTQMLGVKHSGKSTIAYKVIANAQLNYPDAIPVLMDIEGTFDPVWAEMNGIDLDRLVVVDAETGEQAVDLCDALLRAKETSVFILDSLAFLSPLKEIEGSAEDNMIGAQARLINRLVRKVVGAMISERKRNHIVTPIFMNQWRQKVGVMFGDPRVIVGGASVEHVIAYDIILKNKHKAAKQEDGTEVVGHNEHAFEIKKNKMCNSIVNGEFKMNRLNDHPTLDASRIDDAIAMLKFSQSYGIWSGGGKHWKLEYEDINLKFGKRDECADYLYTHPGAYWKLRTHLLVEAAARAQMPEYFLQSISDQKNPYL